MVSLRDEVAGYDWYTVAVQTWLPWMRRYRVTDHFWSEDDCKVTLILVDGSALCVPKMDRRVFKVYPDYKTFKMVHEAPAADEEPQEETLQ
jgi:hypothetical protein